MTGDSVKFRTKYSAAEDAQIIKKYRQRASMTTIAWLLGRSKNGVEQRLQILVAQGRVQRREEHASRILISDADLAWMAYWQQPRAARCRQRLEAKYAP